MPTKITMPQLGESVNEGTVGHWLKNVGDTVKKDESLVEIVTDKVTAELPSPVSGRLTKILAQEDETVMVGAAIAEIEDAGNSDGAGASSTTEASASATAGPETTAGARAGGAVTASVGASDAHEESTNGDRSSRTAAAEKVSPLARRLAEEHHVDLNAIHGTGEGGRVRKEDILAFVGQRTHQPAATAPAASIAAAGAAPTAPPVSPAPAPSALPAPPIEAGEGDQLLMPSPARRAIAEHMVRSKRTAPHATTLVEVDMTNLSRWLERNKDAFKQREGYGISFQAFAIKAVVESLKEHPYMNASWTEDNKILLRKQINIGVSIALENNLMVPVIRDADRLNLAGIARATADLVARARTNKLMPTDLQGATFTVNNPGVFGTLISMAIINQPNAGILTMDAVVKRPVVIDDAIAIRHMMYMSLSFDHRILDGLIAAQFLGAVKRRLESWGPELDVF